MKENKDKYIFALANSKDNANEILKKYSEAGYKLLGPVSNYRGVGGDCWHMTFYLSGFNLRDYAGFVNLDKGSPEQVRYEAAGYVPISEYSKHITWAKPKQIGLDVEKTVEQLIELYGVVEDWDIRDADLPNNILEGLEKALNELGEYTREDAEALDRE